MDFSMVYRVIGYVLLEVLSRCYIRALNGVLNLY